MRAVRGLYRWLDERLGISSAILPLIEHPVPRKVNWWYVLGSATLVAFIVQIITGVALAFSYVPAPNSAYESLAFITDEASLGYIVRGIHYWGASAMVILITLHAARTFVFGSFKYPRELNWLTGVGLLFLTLLMAFSGQLLRWDQDAYWAVVVAAQQAGRVPVLGPLLVDLVVAGETVGGNTLTRFYATHVFLLPAAMFGLIGAHLYLVVRHGISEPPEAGEPVDPKTYQAKYDKLLKEDGVPFWPDAAWRDVIFALAVGSVVLALSIWPGPKELGARADPTLIVAFPRPDWYFLWLFALLALAPPALEDVTIIGLPLLAAIVLIAVPLVANKGERSPRRRPWTLAVVTVTAIAGIVLIRVGDRAPWSPDLDPEPLPAAFEAELQAAGLEEGGELFQTKGCVQCHSVAGVGGSRGPALDSVGSRLSEEQITWRILDGAEGMPAYGDILTPDETRELIAFLTALKEDGQIAADP